MCAGTLKEEMRKLLTELHLLQYATQAICDCNLTTFAVRDASPRQFASNGVIGLYGFLESTGADKLGVIISFALGPQRRTGYRKTSVRDVEGSNNFLEWTGENPKEMLLRLAKPVVAAAIFDILMTRRVLDQDPGSGPHNYLPSDAMRRFVSRQKLPRRKLFSTV